MELRFAMDRACIASRTVRATRWLCRGSGRVAMVVRPSCCVWKDRSLIAWIPRERSRADFSRLQSRLSRSLRRLERLEKLGERRVEIHARAPHVSQHFETPLPLESSTLDIRHLLSERGE